MSCQIKNGKYFAKNGQESKLYKDLVEKVGENKASDLFIFAYSKISYFKSLDENGEPSVNKVLELATKQNASKKTLMIAEQVDMQIQFPNYQNSTELLADFENAFYDSGQFAPTKKTLTKSLYSAFEAENLLSDLTLLSQVKDSIERLKNTKNVEYTMSVESKYKSSDLNIFGKFKTLNPYILEQDLIEKFGGIESDEVEDKSITTDYKRIPVIDENGNAIINKVIYPNAVKLIEDLDNITEEKLFDFGIDASKIKTEVIMDFLQNPSEENTARVNKDAPQREKVIKTDKQDRDLVFLETTKTEEQLFEEQSLIQTEIENVYHKVEKVEEEELRTFLKNQLPSEDKILYRSGDLKVKAEDAYTMRGNRGSGHFGTGFYFFGDLKNANEYDKRKTNAIDTSNYNLLRPRNAEEGLNLHESLKKVNNFNYLNNFENIAETTLNEYELDYYEYKDKINFDVFDSWIVNNREVLEYLKDKISVSQVTPFNNNVQLTSEILGIYKQEFENSVFNLNKELSKVSQEIYNILNKFNGNITEIQIKKDIQNYNADDYNEQSKGQDTLGTRILKSAGFEGIFVKSIKELDNSLYGNIIFDIKQGTEINFNYDNTLEHELYKQYYKYNTPSQSNFTPSFSPSLSNLEYLKGDFLADFNVEILKNPSHEFYNKFHVNEKGINLKYNDPISLNQIEAYLEDGVKLGEELKQYSTISKNIPNFNKQIQTQPNSRLEAVNNISSLKTLSTFVTAIDKNTIFAKNETEQFINYGNEVFELKNKEFDNSVFTKLNITKDVNYFQTEVETQQYVDQVRIKQSKIENFNTLRKHHKESELSDNFNCV